MFKSQIQPSADFEVKSLEENDDELKINFENIQPSRGNTPKISQKLNNDTKAFVFKYGEDGEDPYQAFKKSQV